MCILASYSADGTLRLWNANTGHRLTVLKGHTEKIYAITFSPDGRILASAGWDGTIRLWDTHNCEHLSTFTAEPFSFPYFDLILPRPGRCG